MSREKSVKVGILMSLEGKSSCGGGGRSPYIPLTQRVNSMKLRLIGRQGLGSPLAFIAGQAQLCP